MKHLCVNLSKGMCAAHRVTFIKTRNSGNVVQDGSSLCLFQCVMLLTRGDSSAKKPCVTFDLINRVWGGLVYEDAEPPRAATHGMDSCPIRSTCPRLPRWIIVFADMEFAPGNKQSIRVPAATVPCALLTPHLAASRRLSASAPNPRMEMDCPVSARRRRRTLSYRHNLLCLWQSMNIAGYVGACTGAYRSVKMKCSRAHACWNMHTYGTSRVW